MTARAASFEHAETAIAEFLHGIESRGLVFAEAQCSDPTRAHAAVFTCKISFQAAAASAPTPQWTSLFWRLLLSQPALQADVISDSGDALSQLHAGQRAALLLHLVAGLDQQLAAEVLGASRAACRHALYRAVETLHAWGIDDEMMRARRDRLRRQHWQSTAETLPFLPVRMATPSGQHAEPRDLSSEALSPRGHIPIESAASVARRRRIRSLLIVLLVGLVLVFLTTFFWHSMFLKFHKAPANGWESLREQSPAATLPAAANALAGPDFELLNDQQGEHIARNLDLYAWYAASPAGSPSGPHAPAILPETAAPETSAPDADADPAEGGGAQ